MQSAQFGHYRIIEELGRGGMGVVYRAEDWRNGAQVALKTFVMSEVTEESMNARERFRREGQLLACLNHPGIVRVVDTGEIQGHSYIAMEYLQGEDLKETLKKSGTIDPETALQWFKEMAQALEHIHALGMIHRDIKPANLMLVNDKLKLIDFGLIKASALPKLSQTGMVLGTPAYMAPEQFKGVSSELTAAVDIYALGLTFYVLLTGKSPFARSTIQETFKAVTQSDSTSLDDELSSIAAIPAELRSVIIRCIQSDPVDRFQSASELHEQLIAIGVLEKSEIAGGSKSRLGLILSIFVTTLFVIGFGALFVSTQNRLTESEAELVDLKSTAKTLKDDASSLELQRDRAKSQASLLINEIRARAVSDTDQLFAAVKTSGDPEYFSEVALRAHEGFHLFWKHIGRQKIAPKNHEKTVESTIRLIHLLYSPVTRSLGDDAKAISLAGAAVNALKKLEQTHQVRESIARLYFHELRVVASARYKAGKSKVPSEFNAYQKLFHELQQKKKRRNVIELERLSHSWLNFVFLVTSPETRVSGTEVRHLNKLISQANGSNNRYVYYSMVEFLCKRLRMELADQNRRKNWVGFKKKTIYNCLNSLLPHPTRGFKIKADQSCIKELLLFKHFSTPIDFKMSSDFKRLRDFIGGFRIYKHSHLYFSEFCCFIFRHFDRLYNKGILSNQNLLTVILSLSNRPYRTDFHDSGASKREAFFQITASVAQTGDVALIESVVFTLVSTMTASKQWARLNWIRVQLTCVTAPSLADQSSKFLSSILNMCKLCLSQEGFKEAGLSWLVGLTQCRVACELARRRGVAKGQTVKQQIQEIQATLLSVGFLSKFGPMVMLMREFVRLVDDKPDSFDLITQRKRNLKLFEKAKSVSPRAGAHIYGLLSNVTEGHGHTD